MGPQRRKQLFCFPHSQNILACAIRSGQRETRLDLREIVVRRIFPAGESRDLVVSLSWRGSWQVILVGLFDSRCLIVCVDVYCVSA